MIFEIGLRQRRPCRPRQVTFRAGMLAGDGAQARDRMTKAQAAR
jgi:hypothetical protein